MAAITYEDFSGSGGQPTENPLDALLNACNNDPVELQKRYTAHRTARNAQQASAILSPSFEGWKLDPVLVKLDGPQRDPDFQDPRYCLVLWARPPKAVRNLVATIQERLLKFAPSHLFPLTSVVIDTNRSSELWIMPPPCLHMTAMEVTHSKTKEEIQELVDILVKDIDPIIDYPFHHRARLIKPMVSFDNAALALSFVPAAGEALPPDRNAKDDEFTYHHLRRDLHALCKDHGVTVASRYIVPSAHLTIARFNSPNVFDKGDAMDGSVALDQGLRQAWIEEIQNINKWLEKEYWPSDSHPIQPGGDWLVNEEVGLDFHKGQLWYGGGDEIKKGRSFER